MSLDGEGCKKEKTREGAEAAGRDGHLLEGRKVCMAGKGFGRSSDGKGLRLITVRRGQSGMGEDEECASPQ